MRWTNGLLILLSVAFAMKGGGALCGTGTGSGKSGAKVESAAVVGTIALAIGIAVVILVGALVFVGDGLVGRPADDDDDDAPVGSVAPPVVVGDDVLGFMVDEGPGKEKFAVTAHMTSLNDDTSGNTCVVAFVPTAPLTTRSEL